MERQLFGIIAYPGGAGKDAAGQQFDGWYASLHVAREAYEYALTIYPKGYTVALVHRVGDACRSATGENSADFVLPTLGLRAVATA
jgi:hypothetical protein